LVARQTKVSRHLREQVTALATKTGITDCEINDWSLADVQHKTEKARTATDHRPASWQAGVRTSSKPPPMTEVLPALITAAGTITAAWLATRQYRRGASTPTDTPPPAPNHKDRLEDEDPADPTS
jgi:hypothetical protein